MAPKDVELVVYWKSGCSRCTEPIELLASRGYAISKRNVQKIHRADLERLAALFPTDDDLIAVFVHERKRDAVQGLSRAEILDRIEQDYTYLNRPIVVDGDRIACGPLRFNQTRYDQVFG